MYEKLEFKVSGACFNVDKKPWGIAEGLQSWNPENSQNHAKSFRCWPFSDAGSVCTWYKQNQYKTSQGIHLLKTPNFLTVTDMNMSCYHQVTVAVVSKGLNSI